jgi:hypothetical protein
MGQAVPKSGSRGKSMIYCGISMILRKFLNWFGMALKPKHHWEMLGYTPDSIPFLVDHPQFYVLDIPNDMRSAL